MRSACLLILLSSLILAGCASTAPRGGGPASALMGSASDQGAMSLPRVALQNRDFRPPLDVDSGAGAAMIRAWATPAPRVSPHPIRIPTDLASDGKSWALTDALRRAVNSLDQIPARPLAESPETTDPLGDVFVGNMEDYHIPRDRLVPSASTLDLSTFHNGSFYGRVWTMDTYMKGLGFGIAFPLGATEWRAAAEVGIDWRAATEFRSDPFDAIGDDRVSFLFGISRRF